MLSASPPFSSPSAWLQAYSRPYFSVYSTQLTTNLLKLNIELASIRKKMIQVIATTILIDTFFVRKHQAAPRSLWPVTLMLIFPQMKLLLAPCVYQAARCTPTWNLQWFEPLQTSSTLTKTTTSLHPADHQMRLDQQLFHSSRIEAPWSTLSTIRFTVWILRFHFSHRKTLPSLSFCVAILFCATNHRPKWPTPSKSVSKTTRCRLADVRRRSSDLCIVPLKYRRITVRFTLIVAIAIVTSPFDIGKLLLVVTLSLSDR